MSRPWVAAVLALSLQLAWASAASAQDCGLGASDRALFEAEHLYGGKPTAGDVLVRRGYVAQYDEVHRVPRWVAWRAVNEYRNAVDRTGQFARFRVDPNLWALNVNPVRDPEYDGIYDNGNGYARGHLAPYFIAGGNRNNNSSKAPLDWFDRCTIFEINYMSNVAPQLHNRFNGSGGLWYALETFERQTLLPHGHTLHVIAGTIFGPTPAFVGPNADIGVPDMYYRILVTEQGVVAFLFVHRNRIGPVGCELDAELDACIVAIADIERLAGADFFSALPDVQELELESSDGKVLWQALRAEP